MKQKCAGLSIFNDIDNTEWLLNKFIEASDFGKMSLRSRFEPVMLRREGRKKEFGGY
jgi:hypothetical protein